jgi:hypothetical protein
VNTTAGSLRAEMGASASPMLPRRRRPPPRSQRLRRKYIKFNVLSGGRDRDRTCDPYDVAHSFPALSFSFHELQSGQISMSFFSPFLATSSVKPSLVAYFVVSVRYRRCRQIPGERPCLASSRGSRSASSTPHRFHPMAKRGCGIRASRVSSFASMRAAGRSTRSSAESVAVSASTL